MATIRATATRGGELKPGDLFSTVGPLYWKEGMDNGSIGERVYIRTNSPCPPSQKDEPIYLIEVEK